jgi:energy-coupling factor transporter ATP-binding protein EcfA2
VCVQVRPERVVERASEEKSSAQQQNEWAFQNAAHQHCRSTVNSERVAVTARPR